MDDGRGTRARILDAAEQLFAARGFAATATSAIAALAAVPKGLLFYYFPAKADLLRTLVAERLDLGPVDTAPLVETGNPVRSLLNVTKKLYELQGASDVVRVIIQREQHTHPEVLAHLLEHRKHVQALIERVLQASVMRPLASAPLRAAAQAWVAILTVRPLTHRGSEPKRDDGADDLPALAELICAGLTVGPV
ncbi:MAG: TetR/AcrR family transcriptional regulator [Microbacteriaceae bacterium]|nr:MAG: TetR/AcrR family transcriptional regulator [Microbacteriaceae bacterium]